MICIMDEEPMPREISDGTGQAVLLDIAGRGAEHPVVGCKFLGDKARIGEIGDADRDIKSIANHINEVIGEERSTEISGYFSRKRTRCGATCSRPKVVGAEIRKGPRATFARWETQVSASSTAPRMAITRS